MAVTHRKKNCGRKRKDYSAALANMPNIPASKRTSIRSTAHALGISTWGVYRMTHNEIKRHSNSVKPTLSERHKQERIDYAIRQIDLTSNRMKANYDVVHVDEKWFNIKEVNKKMYLAPGEEPPYRSTGHKSHIGKVMFLCAVARPRRDSTANTMFDGKFGIWPFVQWVEAQRSSRNRPRGTLELKNRTVDHVAYNEFIANKVIPSIGAKWPQCHRNRTIRIQQDNAKPHRSATNTNPDMVAAITATGLDIVFDNQPAQSPDTNILDLGFFNSIQALQQQHKTDNIQQLCQVVDECFKELDATKLEKCFLTHQAVCKEILKADGKNDFKIPHLGKDKTIRRRGMLPVALPVEQEVLDKIAEHRPALVAPPAAAVVGMGVAV